MTRRSLRWTLLVAILAAGATALVLAFLLSLATGNRELYERRTAAGVRLEGRALAGLRSAAAGRALVAVLTRADYTACGAAEHETEGIVDRLERMKIR